jgi:hypothetical protein
MAPKKPIKDTDIKDEPKPEPKKGKGKPGDYGQDRDFDIN